METKYAAIVTILFAIIACTAGAVVMDVYGDDDKPANTVPDDVQTYSITYVLGVCTASNNPSTYTSGTALTLQDPTVPDGYIFTGWYTDEDLTQSITEIPATSTGDLTLYADTTRDLTGTYYTYEITTSLGQGRGSASSTSTMQLYYLAYDKDRGFQTLTVRTDSSGTSSSYSWTGEDDGVDFSYGGTETVDDTINGNVLCYKFVANYMASASSVTETQYIGTEDGVLYRITAEITTGFGWMTQNYTSVYVLSEIGTFDSSDHSVSVYPETGLTVTGEGSYAIGSSVTLSVSASSGTTFAGWYDSKLNLVSTDTTYTFYKGFDDEVYYARSTSDATYLKTGSSLQLSTLHSGAGTWTLVTSDSETQVSGTYTFSAAGDYVLRFDGDAKASYRVSVTDTVGDTYSITYVLGEGTNSSDNPSTYTAGTTVVLKDATPPSGALFAGWYTDEQYTTRISEISASTTGAITLYAGYILDRSYTAYQFDLSYEVKENSFFLTTTTASGTGSMGLYYLSYDKEKGYYIMTTSSVDGSEPTNSFSWSNDEDDIEFRQLQNTSNVSYTVNGESGTAVCVVYQASYTSGMYRITQTQYIGQDNGYPYQLVVERTFGGFGSTVTTMTYTLKSVAPVTVGNHDVSLFPEQGVTVTGDGAYGVGDTVTLTATVADGTTFEGWYNSDLEVVSTDTTYSFTMGLDDLVYFARSSAAALSAESGTETDLAALTSIGSVTGKWTVTGGSEGEQAVEGSTYTFSGVGDYEIRFDGTDSSNRTVRAAYHVMVDGTATKTYTFTYNDKTQTVTLDIKYSDYLATVNLLSVSERCDTYMSTRDMSHDLSFVTADTRDDQYLKSVAEQLETICNAEGATTPQAEANVLLAFVQYIEYSYDSASHGTDEYWNFPLETLWLQTGDCEDTSILFAAIAQYIDLDNDGKQDFDTALFLMNGHMAVGVTLSSFTAPSSSRGSNINSSINGFSYNGTMYYYGETTATGWSIGQVPSTVGNGSTYQNYLIAVMPVPEISS